MSAFLWAVLAALVWGISPLLEKAGLAAGTSPMTGLFYRCLGVFAGLAFFSFIIIKPQEIRSVGLRTALLFMAGGFLASIVGQMCFYNALKLGDVSRLVPVSGSYPFIAFLLGVLFLGEPATGLKFAGAALIAAGVWLLKIG